jgi:hypothetical protein
MKPRTVYIGFDPREAEAFAVARASIEKHLSQSIPIHALVLEDLVARGLYTRPTARRDGKLYDLLSRRPGYDGAMSTEFALSRFLVKSLARAGLAAFIDCDMLVRTDFAKLFDHCETTDPGKALYCVQHCHAPTSTIKMDGQAQTVYPRKNWSSVMVIDCDHPSNRALTLDLVNSTPGADLHAFCWLRDADIGALPRVWTWLADEVPAIVHFTAGGPWFPDYQDVPYAEEWRAVRAGLSL